MALRQILRDFALAILFAVPAAAMATAAHSVSAMNTPAASVSHSAKSPVEDRFSLFAPS